MPYVRPPQLTTENGYSLIYAPMGQENYDTPITLFAQTGSDYTYYFAAFNPFVGVYADADPLWKFPDGIYRQTIQGPQVPPGASRAVPYRATQSASDITNGNIGWFYPHGTPTGDSRYAFGTVQMKLPQTVYEIFRRDPVEGSGEPSYDFLDACPPIPRPPWPYGEVLPGVDISGVRRKLRRRAGELGIDMQFGPYPSVRPEPGEDE